MYGIPIYTNISTYIKTNRESNPISCQRLNKTTCCEILNL